MKKITFNKEKITLLLDVKAEVSSLDKVSSEALSRGLTKKNEFHITLIGNSVGEVIKEKISKLSISEQEKKLTQIEIFVNEFSWNCTPKGEYYFISKTYPKTEGFEEETRRAIIELIDLDDAHTFYIKLNELLGTNFKTPFPHVTLFTTSTREDKLLYGIGISNEDDFRLLNPERI